MARVIAGAAVLTLLNVGCFVFWFQPGLVGVGVYSLVALLAGLGGVLFYLLSGYAGKDRHRALLALELEKEQQLYAEVRELSDDLNELALPDPASQAGRLMGMLEDYRRVIEQKLGDTTITLSSYSQETGRVFKLVINNLRDTVAAAQSVRTTRGDDALDEDPDNEALQRRRALVEQQEARIERLADQNRDLLTALNETTVNVANIQDVNSFELEESLQRLRELGERAQSFNKDSGRPS